MNSACAEVLPAAKRSYGAKAPPARRPVGWFSYTFLRFQDIDFNRPFQKERHLLLADVFLFGFRPPEAASTPSGFGCPGTAEPPLRNSRPAAGNLRATRRAAQKGRWTVLLIWQASDIDGAPALQVPFSLYSGSCRQKHRQDGTPGTMRREAERRYGYAQLHNLCL